MVMEWMVDPLPESPADTKIPVEISDGIVRVDFLNACRLIALLAEDLDADPEALDTDAARILNTIKGIVNAADNGEGWLIIGTLDTPEVVRLIGVKERYWLVSPLEGPGGRFSMEYGERWEPFRIAG